MAGFGATAALGYGLTRGAAKPLLSTPDDLIWGVNGHPISAYPGVPLEDQFKLVKELGFTHYRINLREDGSPNVLNDILRLADRWNITIIPILMPGLNLDTHTAADLKTRSYELGKTMARQFRGRVLIWELANELETYAIIQPCEMRDDGSKYPCEWGPAGGVGPLEYYGPRWSKASAVLAGLSEGVAAGDGKAARAMGTAGFGHLGAFERMAKDKIEWDITVWHDYETVTEPYLETLASYGKPIWVTEFNAGGGGFASPEENAKQISNRIAYYRAMRVKHNVTAAFVYELLDEPYWGEHFEAKMGLVSMIPGGPSGWRLGDLKPAGVAVKAALAAKS